MSRKSHFRHRFVRILFGVPFGLFGLVFAFMLASQLKSWLDSLTFVQVEAKVEEVSLHLGRKGSKTVVAKYSYLYQDRLYSGNQIGGVPPGQRVEDVDQQMYDTLNSARLANEQIVVWVDPASPGRSLVYRDLRWSQTILFFVFSSAIMFPAIALFTMRVENTTFISDRPVRAPSGPRRFLMLYAIWWNLLAWPAAGAALWEMQAGVRLIHAVILLLPAFGIALAIWAKINWRE